MKRFSGVEQLLSSFSPDEPLHIFREHSLKKSIKFFTENFKGKVLYAVKTNPTPFILEKIYQNGIKSFDVASINEIILAKQVAPDAELYFMHTVKSRNAIRDAYFKYGVRNFSLDSLEELEKIIKETKAAKDLNLFVRLGIPNSYAEINLSDKFGIGLRDAPALLKRARLASRKLGICFHVGSQCMHPDAYRIAIRMANNLITQCKIKLDVLDVGGGFPSIYPGMFPPALITYFQAIEEEFKKIKGYRKIELICEPGRAIVAESGSVVVKVEHRKDYMLYINDGTYGSLFDAGTPHFIFPVKIIRKRKSLKKKPVDFVPFSFFGPTCDTMDFMKGPFYLPEDIKEGDYIEIGQLGAYGRTLATEFNGFKPAQEIAFVDDEPLLTMYDGSHISSEPLEVIAA